MILIHARSYAQANNHARNRGLSYTQWNYVSLDNMRGLKGMEMRVLPGADQHEEHAKIMQQAKLDEHKVIGCPE